MQTMSERSVKLLWTILCLLPGSVTSIACSLSEDTLEVLSCPSFCRNASNDFHYGSARCIPVEGLPFFSGFNVGPGLVFPVYIILDLAPLMIYFPVLILFNINLASGPGQSFLFFYQTLPAATAGSALSAAIGTDAFWSLLTMQSPINDIVFPRTLPYIALQHCKLGAVLVAIVMAVVLVKCVHCPCASWRRPWAKLCCSVRHFREKRACKGTVLNGLCSIVILTYGFVIQQSFTVLRPSSCCPSGAKYCAYHCTELEYGNGHSLAPIVAAAVFIILFALLLPLLLLYYPCVPALMQHVTKRSPQFMTCHKLAPVLDVFQSVYKPKLRFFAALPLIYRFVIWCLFSALSAELGRKDILIVITFAFIVILALHSLVQPYSNPKHNYIETLYLVNLVLITMMLLFSQLAFIRLFSGSGSRLAFPLLILPTPLMCLPILICVGYFFWKLKCCKRCRASCCERVKQNWRRSAQSEAVRSASSEVSTSEVYFDMSEVGQWNQD